MRDTMFVRKDFVMHSGETGHFKIECDALTDADIETLAFIISEKTKHCTRSDGSGIKQVRGVPTGGVHLAKALEKYIDPNGDIKLIVDDVLTTGRSMIEMRDALGWSSATGIVIFARGKCPDWILPIFDMYWFNTNEL